VSEDGLQFLIKVGGRGTVMTMADKPKPEPKDRDEPVAIPLDPEAALSALLQVEPEGSEEETQQDDPSQQ